MFITLFFASAGQNNFISLFSNRIVANLRSVRQLVLKFYKNPPSRYNYPSVVRKVPPSPNLGTSNSIAIS